MIDEFHRDILSTHTPLTVNSVCKFPKHSPLNIQHNTHTTMTKRRHLANNPTPKQQQQQHTVHASGGLHSHHPLPWQRHTLVLYGWLLQTTQAWGKYNMSSRLWRTNANCLAQGIHNTYGGLDHVNSIDSSLPTWKNPLNTHTHTYMHTHIHSCTHSILKRRHRIDNINNKIQYTPKYSFMYHHHTSWEANGRVTVTDDWKKEDSKFFCDR